MLRAAIIGCGSIYKLHANALLHTEQSELACVIDNRPERAQRAAELYSCQWYSDWTSILEDDSIHVVHICTPHHLHHTMGLEFLKHGKHVLCEKPIASEVRDAEAMIAAAESCQRHLGVVFQNRYNPNARRAKELLAQNHLGDVLGVKAIVPWHRDRAYYNSERWRGHWESEGGGVLINQAIHTIDMIQWLAGDITSVQGQVATCALADTIEVEDMASGYLQFAGGQTGVFFATNDYTTNAPVEVELHCLEGTITLRGEDLIVNGEPMATPSDRSQSIIHKSYWGLGHEDLIQRFYQAVAENRRDYVSGRDGLRALQVVKAFYHSSLSRQPVRLPDAILHNCGR